MGRDGDAGELHEVQRLAGALFRLAGELIDAPAWSLSTAEKVDVLLEVEAAGRAVEAARLGVIRSLDGQDLQSVGATSLAGLLRARCQVGPGRARADVATARATDPHTPPGTGTFRAERGALVGLGAALANGRVSRPHVDAAVRTLEKIPHKIRAACGRIVDGFFLDVSVRHPPRDCEDLAKELLDRLDPDRSDRCYDPDAFARRGFDMVDDSTGMVIVKGQLDPATGAQLKAAIEHFAAPDPAVLGEDGLPIRWDERTPSQRRADALGLIASKALAHAGSKGGEPPRVVVHVTVEQLAAIEVGRNLGEQTAAGRAWCEQVGFLTPDTLQRIGCSAVFERVLTGPNGRVLSLGRTVRLATPAQRRALAARDKTCIIPGCTRPSNQCDAHHVKSWITGGLTDVDEMVLVCGPHHNAIHAGVYHVVMIDGIPWTRRRGSDALTRNTLFDDGARARAAGEQVRLDLGLQTPRLSEELWHPTAPENSPKLGEAEKPPDPGDPPEDGSARTDDAA